MSTLGTVGAKQLRCIHSPRSLNRVWKASAPRASDKLKIKDGDQLSFATRYSSVIVDRQDQVEIKGHGTADRMFGPLLALRSPETVQPTTVIGRNEMQGSSNQPWTLADRLYLLGCG